MIAQQTSHNPQNRLRILRAALKGMRADWELIAADLDEQPDNEHLRQSLDVIERFIVDTRQEIRELVG